MGKSNSKTSVGPSRRSNLIKLTVAGLALVCAGIVFAITSGPQNRVSDSAALVRVYCGQCQAVYDIPFSQYQQMSPRGTDLDGPIRCLRCSAQMLNRAPRGAALSEGPATAADQSPPPVDDEETTIPNFATEHKQEIIVVPPDAEGETAEGEAEEAPRIVKPTRRGLN